MRDTDVSEEKDDLTIAYMAGSASRNDEIRKLEQERDQLKEKLEIATGALSHYLYGGSNYSQIARDALEEIKGEQHENNT